MCCLWVIGSPLVLCLATTDRLLVCYWHAVGCIRQRNQLMAHTGSIATQIILFLYLKKTSHHHHDIISLSMRTFFSIHDVLVYYIIRLGLVGLILILYCMYFGFMWTDVGMLSVHNGLLLVDFLPPLPQVKLLNQTADLQAIILDEIRRSSGRSSLIVNISSHFVMLRVFERGKLQTWHFYDLMI